MGNAQTIRIHFEDMQQAMKKPERFLIINTMSTNDQHCLIWNTISEKEEETVINRYLTENKHISIVVYGKNGVDESAEKKCKQLQTLGFSHVYLYVGGMFEWLLLQDIYGKELFPTMGGQVDMLKYRAASVL